VLLVVASSCDPEKFCTLSDCVPWYDGSHTTSLRQQGDGTLFSLNDPKTAAGDSCDIHDLHDLCDLHDLRDPHDLLDQLC
jgi:hypothetical protein